MRGIVAMTTPRIAHIETLHCKIVCKIANIVQAGCEL